MYDTRTKTLTERKTRIKRIYDGHRYQRFAQVFCLEEIGYSVESLCIQSLQDNRRYHIPLPTSLEVEQFEETLQKIRRFDPATDAIDSQSEINCRASIYRHLSY